MAVATWTLSGDKLGITEGGYWDDPVGGPTNRGITLGTLRMYHSVIGLTSPEAANLAALMALSEADARKIWKVGYWDRAYCDRLPIGLDYAVFDIAINSGPPVAIKLLQQALGLNPDGVFGPKTASAVARCNVPATIARMGSARMQFMVKLKNWKPNATGWALRVAAVTSDAIALA
ncbi:hypothetical protein EN866_19575 [Mesorhizobium sp. M2D.F.Ca.ET.223.01.1.1]|uniref:glycoside hydrolase family 108 protein n=2 Tax=Mesorhizobium TaxID=68287 RepID=UPI000FC99753|nr:MULTISPECIES: glycosyl hydrolase 108 family protein [unclassified Mesorhizobium]TGP89362.1 hypothetical protein EN864_19585 [bacterium M00.F.Ca.ET.221.01.1.1]TGP94735.1 hypothetical protein EN865_15455 [bacterium M00.F.Ca.ET.222.01.1.1]RVD58851.1 hypothetical protein EN783_14540 [Mesorhizobium sp. M2D.F.Ca.ET.140.01.1.1]TGP27879.1 hypothetical protein EN875_033020 [Mesorhizobium sp. M2D.F.Ca.ET.232.01.1.1]TGP75903.1 hypothetical protein EN867_15455 [Mesorhizobium sp. M2D.F.Ca.ET.224.01.1.1]